MGWRYLQQNWEGFKMGLAEELQQLSHFCLSVVIKKL